MECGGAESNLGQVAARSSQSCGSGSDSGSICNIIAVASKKSCGRKSNSSGVG